MAALSNPPNFRIPGTNNSCAIKAVSVVRSRESQSATTASAARAGVIEIGRFAHRMSEHDHQLVAVLFRREEQEGKPIAFANSPKIEAARRIAFGLLDRAGFDEEALFRQLDLQRVPPGGQHHFL